MHGWQKVMFSAGHSATLDRSGVALTVINSFQRCSWRTIQP